MQLVLYLNCICFVLKHSACKQVLTIRILPFIGFSCIPCEYESTISPVFSSRSSQTAKIVSGILCRHNYHSCIKPLHWSHVIPRVTRQLINSARLHYWLFNAGMIKPQSCTTLIFQFYAEARSNKRSLPLILNMHSAENNVDFGQPHFCLIQLDVTVWQTVKYLFPFEGCEQAYDEGSPSNPRRTGEGEICLRGHLQPQS